MVRIANTFFQIILSFKWQQIQLNSEQKRFYLKFDAKKFLRVRIKTQNRPFLSKNFKIEAEFRIYFQH